MTMLVRRAVGVGGDPGEALYFTRKINQPVPINEVR